MIVYREGFDRAGECGDLAVGGLLEAEVTAE
jgi:hypothetical protein